MVNKKQKKYYVVWNGRNTGVYDNWDDAKRQVENYSGARYKSFATEAMAREAFENGPSAYLGHAPERPAHHAQSASLPGMEAPSQPLTAAIAVDAACSGNPGVMEYRGVSMWDRREIFHQKYAVGTNNVGEFLAIVHALALIKQKGCEGRLSIYSDSKIAIGWVRKGRCRTKLEYTPLTAELFDVVRRAERWLADNAIRTPIIKWPTELWGEVPADFGRKG